ncbi:hypothetical protein CL633_02370 [bacterium]|nr:hypothetical protein [bacterium]|tara:strand:- start:151 stop:612 length:462 start_codon:yes stop_codon:yes gene_type:complete
MPIEDKVKDKRQGTTAQNILNAVYSAVARALKVLIYGWDGSNWVSIRVNSAGEPKIAGAGATGQTIYNVNVASANTEYTQVFPANTKRYFIKSRSQAKSFRLAFAKGSAAISAVHMTIPANGYISPDGLDLTGATAVFESKSAGHKLEIIVHS